jgi:hypothetical protein
MDDGATEELWQRSHIFSTQGAAGDGERSDRLCYLTLRQEGTESFFVSAHYWSAVN